MVAVYSTNTITHSITNRWMQLSSVRLVEASTTCCRALSVRLRRTRRKNASAWNRYNTWLQIPIRMMLVCRVSVCRVNHIGWPTITLHHFLTHKTKKSCNVENTKCIDATQMQRKRSNAQSNCEFKNQFPQCIQSVNSKAWGFRMPPHINTATAVHNDI